MSYGKVETTFWRDPAVRALSEDGRTFFFYVLTCPHRNRIGLFYLDPTYAAADLRWSIDRAVEALEEVCEAHRVAWDSGTGVLYVRNHFRHNTLRNQQAVAGAVTELSSVPDCPFFGRVLADVENYGRAHYRALSNALRLRAAKCDGGNVENLPDAPKRIASPDNPVDDPVNGSLTCLEAVPFHTEAKPSRADLAPNVPSPLTGDGFEVLDALPSAALHAFESMGFPQSKEAASRTLVARFLYPDESPEMGDRSVRGLDIEGRLTLVASAVVELADQVGEWKPAALRAFISSLRRKPPAHTEAAAVHARGEPTGRYIPTRQYREPEPEGEIARANFTEILKANGVDGPRRLPNDQPGDEPGEGSE